MHTQREGGKLTSQSIDACPTPGKQTPQDRTWQSSHI